MSYQKVIIVGNLGRDPEMSYLPNSGQAVTNFNVATNRQYTPHRAAAAGADQQRQRGAAHPPGGRVYCLRRPYHMRAGGGGAAAGQPPHPGPAGRCAKFPGGWRSQAEPWPLPRAFWPGGG